MDWTVSNRSSPISVSYQTLSMQCHLEARAAMDQNSTREEPQDKSIFLSCLSVFYKARPNKLPDTTVTMMIGFGFS